MDTKSLAQQKRVFESLKPQEAIVTMNNQPVLVTTPTVPRVHVDKKRLQAIENTYARKLLTPRKDIERGERGRDFVVLPGSYSPDALGLPPAAKRAKRRMEK